MIAGLRGTLARWDEASSTLWLDVGGVIYEVLIPAFASSWVATYEEGVEMALFTYYHVNERQPRPVLIGFPRLAERDFFRKFIEVPDVGPVRAVRALDRQVSEIARAIEDGDTKALQQLPGIGARTAQTIIAHLQGRLLEEATLPDATGHVPATGEPSVRDDAIEALLALQYGRREAESMVTAALDARPEINDLETLLRAVLEQRVRS